MIRAILALLMLTTSLVAEIPPEPDSYRMEDYRAPVPATLKGAVTVNVEEAHALWQSGQAAFVDVWPRPPKPAGLPKGTLWRDPKRFSIPGAIWLPNVGYGALADVTLDYFQRGLEKASNGDKTQPLVIFCLAECWMSWNAAKRALELGYASIYWFPEGTDGWDELFYPLEEVIAETEP